MNFIASNREGERPPSLLQTLECLGAHFDAGVMSFMCMRAQLLLLLNGKTESCNNIDWLKVG